MSTLRVNSGTIIASPTWEPTGLLQDQVLTLSGLFYSPVAFGTPYRFSLPAGRNGPSLRAIAHSLIDLGAVAAARPAAEPSPRHGSQHRDRQHAIDRLFRPLPPEIKRVLVIVHHISRFSLRRPQCGSLREGLNSRTWPRFNARMTPIRANIVGPPDVATRIKASIAACHSAAWCSAFGSDVVAGILQGDELATARQLYRIVKLSSPAAIGR